MVRFVHTADLQLGMGRRFLAPEAQARFAQARIDAIRSLAAVVARERAEFVVVSGDVFESNHVDRRVVGRTLEALEAVRVPVFLLPGNHDPLGAGSVYRSSAFESQQPANVIVLDSAEPFSVRPGVEVVGAPWPTKRPLSDLVADACAGLAPDPGTTRVLVGHGAVDALFPERRDPALIQLSAMEGAIAEGRVHYIALGDRHSRTQVGASGRIWYSGSPEPTDHDETDPGHVLVVTLDDGAVDVAPHRVGTWSFVRHEVRLDQPDDLDSLAAWLDARTDKDRTVIRLCLVGTLTLREHARLDELLDARVPLFATLERWANASELLVLPDTVDAAELDVTGFASNALVELGLAAASPRDDSRAASDALALAFRLTRAACPNGRAA
jgi:DNA repair exonuclease SbcCD nuclease subunit